MSKGKKINKKTNPKVQEKPNKSIQKNGGGNPKKMRQQLQKVKKVVKADLGDTPAPVLVEVADGVEQPEVKGEIEAGTKPAIKAQDEMEVVESAPNSPKAEKKLKKKLKKVAEKEKTADSVAGPGQTIFVGNVPSNTKRVQLLKLFGPCGKIMSIRFRTANGKVIFKHKMRKESAALNAYVVFDTIEAANKALELNGTALKDQILRVQKPENVNESSDPKNTVFVGSLKYSATDDKLHQIFSSCGEIEYVRTLQSADKKGCIGTAFVCFKNPDSVGLALELKGTMLDERPIHVERYSVKKLGANTKRIAEQKNLAKVKPKGGKPLERAALELRKKTQHSGQIHSTKKTQDNKPQDEKKKKSEFRGVKSEKMNKKPKKKIPSQMKRLANKIAPKE